MFDISQFPQADAVRRAAQLSQDEYKRLYKESIEHPSAFWAAQATRFLDWMTPWQTVQRYDLKSGDATWFAGGKLNVSANCIDRHLDTRGDQTAIIWEGDNPAESAEISYRKLHHHVCRLANVLKSLSLIHI